MQRIFGIPTKFCRTAQIIGGGFVQKLEPVNRILDVFVFRQAQLVKHFLPALHRRAGVFKRANLFVAAGGQVKLNARWIFVGIIPPRIGHIPVRAVDQQLVARIHIGPRQHPHIFGPRAIQHLFRHGKADGVDAGRRRLKGIDIALIARHIHALRQVIPPIAQPPA